MADKFEYRIVVSEDDDETDQDTLNRMGEDGWDLVSAIADVRANEDADEDSLDEDDNVPVTVFYMKRRKE
jgi:hypothetical protein